jgi:hypothetical protein
MVSDMAVMESSDTLKVYGPVVSSRCSRMHMSATGQAAILDRVPLCGSVAQHGQSFPAGVQQLMNDLLFKTPKTICSPCRRVLEGTDSASGTHHNDAW